MRVFLFCRYPELGKVKSRLAAQCGDEKALLLYEKMLASIFASIDASGRDLTVYYTGCDEAVAQSWLAGRKSVEQSQGDLGQRLISALQKGFSESDSPIVLIGADCLGVDAGLLNEVTGGLQDHDVVIGPATDGGYYLLALKSLSLKVFENIEWGGDTVLAQTLNNASEVNLNVKLLVEKTDMDYLKDIPESWRHEVGVQ